MTTSTHADAPRGMDFLYSLNRSNVATSRAKCFENFGVLAGVVCAGMQDETPAQMRIANAFCRYSDTADCSLGFPAMASSMTVDRSTCSITDSDQELAIYLQGVSL
jgi:hypothetical protein